MDILILKTKDGIEIFENGAKLLISFDKRPDLKPLDENEIKELYLAKSL